MFLVWQFVHVETNDIKPHICELDASFVCLFVTVMFRYHKPLYSSSILSSCDLSARFTSVGMRLPSIVVTYTGRILSVELGPLVPLYPIMVRRHTIGTGC